MLAKRTKGVFVDVNEFSMLVAVASSLEPPLTIESLTELPVSLDSDAVHEKLDELVEQKKGRGYIDAHCAIYPPSRFVRRATLESPAKAKDPNFFPELLKSQFRVDPTTNSAAVLLAQNGSEFSLEKSPALLKEIVFVGAKDEELRKAQDRIVDCGIFPNRIEIGSLSSVGGLINYAQFKNLRFPTLMLEITGDNSNVFIFNQEKLDISRPIPYGLNSMYPVIQQELGLKDEESAKKLLFSNTFDFTEMGPSLLKKMLKELQASTGFYEVQTGQTIGQIFLSLLPKNLNWIHQTLSRTLGVDVLNIDYGGWLKNMGISVGSDVQLEGLDSRWLGLFSLMGKYQSDQNGTEER